MDIALQTRLPHRPYCTSDPHKGVRIRPRSTAITKRYIQLNPPAACWAVVFDIDDRDLRGSWYDAHLPAPTYEVRNPNNGRGHLVYALETPVCTSEAARLAPLRYLAAIQAALTVALGADPAYAGLLAKNPWHSHWHTTRFGDMYSLGYLAEWLTLRKTVAAREAIGLGRNCVLFDEVRRWAYSWIRTYQKNGASTEQWHAAVLAQAESGNTVFSPPLPFSEVRAVAKSVAKFCWKHFSAQAFSAVQSARGKRGGRPRTTTASGRPWDSLGISRATYYRRRNSGLLVPR